MGLGIGLVMSKGGILTGNDRTGAAGAGSVTISHLFGELAWLFTQSERHNSLPISELTCN